MITASPCPPSVLVATVPASVLVTFGLAPIPFFWKTTGLEEVPVAVKRIGAVMLSVWSAATLKVTPPLPTPAELSAAIADSIVA